MKVKKLNELKSETLRSAADKARSLGRKKQAQRFEDEYNYRSTNDMRRKLYNKFGKDFKNETVFENSSMILSKAVSKFGDIVGYILETPTGYMFASKYSDISYGEAAIICAKLDIDESDVSFVHIADIEDYLKDCLSVSDARKVAREFTEYFDGMQKFDWHKYAEL